MTERSETTTRSAGIENMAQRLWAMKCDCYAWPQRDVSWDRLTEEGRNIQRAHAVSLLMEYQRG